MTKEQYENWTRGIKSSANGVTILRYGTRVLTVFTMLSYGILLVYEACSRQWTELYHSILVPGVSFVVVSLFRSVIPAKRPYEELEIQPLLHKETEEKSFPSRHVFSIFMIAMTMADHNIWLGLFFMILGVVLAVFRVLGGVHYVRDVVAGAAIGILCGILGYVVIF